LPKRLRALGQLLRSVDAHFTTQHTPPAATLLAPQKSSPTPVVDERQAPDVPFDDVGHLVTTLNQLVNHQLLPLLKQYQLQVARLNELTQAQVRWLHGYFRKRLYPLLTPLAIDPGHPFPRLVPDALYFLVSLRATGSSALGAPSHSLHPTPATGERAAAWPDGELYSLLKISEHGPRLLPIPVADEDHSEDGSEDGSERMTTLFLRENIVKTFLAELFVGMEIAGVYQFRISSAATLNQCPAGPTPEPRAPFQDREQSAETDWHKFSSATAAGARQTSQSAKGIRTSSRVAQPAVTHIEVEETMPPHLVAWLTDHLQMAVDAVLYAPLPLGMADLSESVDSCLTQQPVLAGTAT